MGLRRGNRVMDRVAPKGRIKNQAAMDGIAERDDEFAPPRSSRTGLKVAASDNEGDDEDNTSTQGQVEDDIRTEEIVEGNDFDDKTEVTSMPPTDASNAADIANFMSGEPVQNETLSAS